MTETDAAASFDVFLVDAEGQRMSESHATTWPDLVRRVTAFTATRAATPRAVVDGEGREIFWQDGLEMAREGETVSFGFFVNGRLLSA